MITKKTNGGNMIKNKKIVNEVRAVLLKELEKQFKDQDSNLLVVFKNSIKGAINKTAHDINYDIINYGEFKGWRK
tara:strand:- start:125 stop:349 length:225 start_codon:yes stop_codon:yes gene_type:complete